MSHYFTKKERDRATKFMWSDATFQKKQRLDSYICSNITMQTGTLIKGHLSKAEFEAGRQKSANPGCSAYLPWRTCCPEAVGKCRQQHTDQHFSSPQLELIDSQRGPPPPLHTPSASKPGLPCLPGLARSNLLLLQVHRLLEGHKTYQGVHT